MPLTRIGNPPLICGLVNRFSVVPMSYSRVMYQRFRERALRRRIVAAIYVLVMIVYLGWRVTIINHNALGLSLIYFTAETLGFVLGLTTIFCSWTYRHREPKPAPRGLTVDVFIPTYREPVEIVRWTAVAAKEIAYPHQTFLLDDGNRPELKALAEELGIRYLAREQNTGAKAGNLNNGLAHSNGEFIMVFDADHIAMPHALDVLLGFFSDERVGLVQTPEEFYNIDAFQYFNARRSGGLWNDQSFFYGFTEPCKDAMDGTSCIGTGVVYRRSALEQIGGIPVETVTEDVHTSLKLHAAGFKVAYLNEPVAYGLAAADLNDFYKTRHRWAHGNLHVLRRENIFTMKGLTLWQRLSYLTLGIVYLEGWQQLMLIAVPITSLLFGWAPFEITVLNVLIVLLFPILTLLLLQEIGCGLARPWANEVFSMARFPVHIAAWAALVVDKIPFRSSTKNIRGRVDWLLMAPQLGLMTISLVAFAIGVMSLALNFKIGPLGFAASDLLSGRAAHIDWNQRLDQGYTLELVIVAGFWALFNAAKAFALISKAIANARRSTDEYRFDTQMILEFDDMPGRNLAYVDRVSGSWASVRLHGQAPLAGKWFAARLHLPTGELPVECVVTRSNRARDHTLKFGRHAITVTAGAPLEARFECEFIWSDKRGRDRLLRSLYSVDWRREYVNRTAFFSTPIDVLTRLARLRAPFDNARLNWSPALCHDAGRSSRRYAVVALHPGQTSMSIIAFQAIDAGTVLEFEIVTVNGLVSRFVRITGQAETHSLGSKGLDGSEVRKYHGQLVPPSWTEDAIGVDAAGKGRVSAIAAE